jgi:hypothetical protein
MDKKCPLILTLLFIVVDIIVSKKNRGREHSFNDYINLQVNRTIDLSESIIHFRSQILIKSMKVDPIYSYKLPILKNNSKYLINLEAKLKSPSGDEEIISLKVTKQTYPLEKNYDYYEINFKSEPMNYEEERILIISEDYFERLNLLPKKIHLKDDQLVVFTDSVNLISFYQTNTQKTTVILPHERTEVVYVIKIYFLVNTP